MAKVVYDKRDRIGYITLNRPEALNALDDELDEEFMNVMWYVGKFDEATWQFLLRKSCPFPVQVFERASI